MHIVFLNPQGNFDRYDSYWTEHPDFGGQLVYVKELACAMGKLGCKVDIITRQIIDKNWPEFSDKFDFYEDIENVRIIRLPAGPDVFLPKELLWEHLYEWVNNIIKFYKKEGSYLIYNYSLWRWWYIGSYVIRKTIFRFHLLDILWVLKDG